MAKLKNIITQLKEDEYEGFVRQLNKTGGEKFLTLLKMYREDLPNNKQRDAKIKDALEVNDSAYYALKSRLLDKIQMYLSNRFSKVQVDSIEKIEDIPDLIFATERNKAIAILQNLELDVRTHDSPYKLASIYDALKKLHIHHTKYYDYTQQYNRHIAYTIALDKASDLQLEFFNKLGEYDFTRDPNLLVVMSLLQQELYNVSKLYDSHHLLVHRYIVDISYDLFLPEKRLAGIKLSTQELLSKLSVIFDENPNDKTYRHMRLLHHFLSFVFAFQNNLKTETEMHFDEVNESVQQFMLYNYCSFPSLFLMMKLERALAAGTENRLYDLNIKWISEYDPDRLDVPNYVNFLLYRSVSAFYNGRYPEAATTIVRMMNEISFIKSDFREVETKLYLSLCYLLSNETDLAQMHLKSVSRKIKELETDGLTVENIRAMHKILNSFAANNPSKNEKEKIEQLLETYNKTNNGRNVILKFLYSGEKLMKIFDKLSKRKY